jgi:hypothetical protein
LEKREQASLPELGDWINASLLRWCCAGTALLFIIGVAFQLNGSSVGMWRELLSEPDGARGLVFSTPKRIRVDEWGIWTPSMLSQARQTPPFPIENPNLGAGRSPLIMNMPVAYYTTFFRPQFFGFFVFDFARGFSFYWCAKFFGLLLAAGWAMREVGVRSRLLVIFGAVWVSFSSYVQWWFSSPAMLPEMLASWFVCLGCAIRFFKDQHPGKTALAFLCFIFFGINFVLCLYPPYQIPLTLLFMAMLAGKCRDNHGQTGGVPTMRAVVLLTFGVIAVGLILLPFWFDVRPTLEMVAHTVYPGERRSSGGALSLFRLLSGVVGFFQYEQTYPDTYDNISEASNFYPLWLAAALVILMAGLRAKTPISSLLVALFTFLFGLSLYCVLPMPEWLLRTTFLSFSTEQRTLLPLGIANIFFCCLFLDGYRSAILSRRTMIGAGISLWFGLLILLWSARAQNTVYFSDPWHWIQPLASGAGILLLLFWERLRYRWLPVILGLLLISSNAPINPVTRGLSPLLDSVAFNAIDRIRASDPEGRWIVYHTRYFAQLVKATGAAVFNGTKIVPDLASFHQLDPSGANEFVYNRYANITCEIPKLSHEVSASLVYPDFYILFLPPNLPVLANAGYRYILYPKEWTDAARYGFTLIEKITPGDLWIYRHD